MTGVAACSAFWLHRAMHEMARRDKGVARAFSGCLKMLPPLVCEQIHLLLDRCAIPVRQDLLYGRSAVASRVFGGAGSTAGMAGQRPLKTAWRFSRKAEMPSCLSSVP